MATEKIKLNGVEYLWPKRPVVVVCIDGGDPEYIEAGIKDGIIPNIECFMKNGFYAVAQGSMPSFTVPIICPLFPVASLRCMVFPVIST